MYSSCTKRSRGHVLWRLTLQYTLVSHAHNPACCTQPFHRAHYRHTTLLRAHESVEARRFALSQPPPMTTRAHLRVGDGAGAAPATAAAAPATPDTEVRSLSALGEAGDHTDAALYQQLSGFYAARAALAVLPTTVYTLSPWMRSTACTLAADPRRGRCLLQRAPMHGRAR